MCQYGTLLAHANRMGVQPVLSDYMKSELLKHFPNLRVPSESELPGCAFNWTDIDTNGTNQLEIGDVQVGHEKDNIPTLKKWNIFKLLPNSRRS
jgi:hypothetical protein